jgi:hypothetical protein
VRAAGEHRDAAACRERGIHHRAKLAGRHYGERRARRVVRSVAPGRARRAGARIVHLAHDVGDLRPRDRARAQQRDAAAEAGDDRRLQPDLAVAAVQHERDARAELLAHVGRAGRADAAVAVRGGCRDAAAEGREQRARNRMRGRAQGDARLPARHRRGNARGLRQHQRQRTGPEGLGEARGRLGQLGRPVARGGEAAQVHDQRVRRRPALGREDARDRGGIRRVRPEAVHGFRRECDELARVQQGDGFLDLGGAWQHRPMIAAARRPGLTRAGRVSSPCRCA